MFGKSGLRGEYVSMCQCGGGGVNFFGRWRDRLGLGVRLDTHFEPGFRPRLVARDHE